MDIKYQNYKRSNSKKGFKKKNSMNKAKNKTMSSYSNQGSNTKSSKNKRNLDEMMKDYKKFVKKYFGNINPKDYIPENRVNEILEGRDKNYFDQNVILQNQKNYLIYEKLLENNTDCDFDEEIKVELPSKDKIFYCKKDRLGNHKNNQKDYSNRKKKYEHGDVDSDNTILTEHHTSPNKEEKVEEEDEKDKEDEEDEEAKGDKEEEEEKELEDQAHENIRPDSKSPVCDDYDTRMDKENKVKTIQKIFREKRTKPKLYVGMDKTQCNIIRIYADEYDQNEKIKSLKVYIYLILDKELIVLNKAIKELLKRDSISKNSLMKCIDEVIEKILARKDDTINLVNETARSKGLINSLNKEEEIFIVKKKNVNKEEDKKDNNEKKEDKKKNDSEKEDSLIGDADYDF